MKQNRRHFLLAVLFLCVPLLFPQFLSAADTEQCAICGMKTGPTAKTGFDSERKGKPVYLCSFACAHRYHQSKEYREAPLFAHDYKTGSRVDAKQAFYLIKSSNISKELEFDMPPTVIAFSSEQLAKETQTRLKDGEVVKGFETVEKAYGK